MSHITHYENLKVSENATIEVIRAAYRVLAQRHHPDVNSTKDSVRVMQIINEAWTVLSDPVQRAEHDAWIARTRESISTATDEVHVELSGSQQQERSLRITISGVPHTLTFKHIDALRTANVRDLVLIDGVEQFNGNPIPNPYNLIWYNGGIRYNLTVAHEREHVWPALNGRITKFRLSIDGRQLYSEGF